MGARHQPGRLQQADDAGLTVATSSGLGYVAEPTGWAAAYATLSGQTGKLTAPGYDTYRWAACGVVPSDTPGKVFGGHITYRKHFPALPASFTWSTLQQVGWTATSAVDPLHMNVFDLDPSWEATHGVVFWVDTPDSAAAGEAYYAWGDLLVG